MLKSPVAIEIASTGVNATATVGHDDDTLRAMRIHQDLIVWCTDRSYDCTASERSLPGEKRTRSLAGIVIGSLV
jgi:hypothetical protein